MTRVAGRRSPRHRHGGRRLTSRFRALGVLTAILAVVCVAGVWQALRSERLKWQTAMCYYAADAARQWRDLAWARMYRAVIPWFGIIGHPPVRRGTPLPPPDALRLADGRIRACHCGPQLSPASYVRVDLADSTMTTSVVATRPMGDVPTVQPGLADPPTSDRSIADAAVLRGQLLRAAPIVQREDVAAIPIRDSSGRVQSIVMAVAIGASDGSARALYGAEMAPSVFAQATFGSVFETTRLFPSDLIGTTPNSAVVSAEVQDMSGTVMYRSGTPGRGCTAQAPPAPAMADLLVDLRLNESATRWTIGRSSPSSIPSLAVLLAAVLASGAATAVIARREAELGAMRSDFVTGVSHELRMPLAQILLFGEMLALHRVPREADRDAAADTIVREARRLAALVDNVLHFSRVEHHQVRLSPEPTALAPLVEEVVQGARPVLGRGTEIAITIPGPLNLVVDAAALRQILLNLLDNAVKYGPRGQRVTIGALLTGSRVRIWVEDEGPGIPAGQERTIFEPFVRLDRDRNTAVAGSGIGLAVVRDLVTRLDGRVWVERVARRGARVVCDLPAAPRST